MAGLLRDIDLQTFILVDIDIDEVHGTNSRRGLLVVVLLRLKSSPAHWQITAATSTSNWEIAIKLQQAEDFIYLEGKIDQSCTNDIEKRIGLSFGVVKNSDKI